MKDPAATLTSSTTEPTSGSGPSRPADPAHLSSFEDAILGAILRIPLAVAARQKAA
jgi:hypothetical protein